MIAASIAFSFGHEHRKPVYCNCCLLVLCALHVALLCSLFYFGPNWWTCLWRVNCDTNTTMHTNYPFWSKFTMTKLTACMFGPQISTWLNNLGTDYELPILENQCHTTNPLYQKITFPDFEPWNYFPFYTPTCNGPHNCLDGFAKFIVTSMTIICCSCIVFTIFMVFRGPFSWNKKQLEHKGALPYRGSCVVYPHAGN